MVASAEARIQVMGVAMYQVDWSPVVQVGKKSTTEKINRAE